jgi:hypothetical protein
MRALESLVLAVRRLPPGVRDDVLRAALIAGIVVARDIQHLQGIDVRPCRVGKDQSSTTTSDGIYRDWFTTSGSKSVSKAMNSGVDVAADASDRELAQHLHHGRAAPPKRGPCQPDERQHECRGTSSRAGFLTSDNVRFSEV